MSGLPDLPPVAPLLCCCLQLVVVGPNGEQRWEAGPNRTLSLAVPPPEDILPPPEDAPEGTKPTEVRARAPGHLMVGGSSPQ